MVLLALLLAAANAGAREPGAPARLYAAAGKADITPDLARESVRLAGYGASGRKAQGIHDPLYARAVVVSDGERTVAVVGVDSIGLFREDVLDMRRSLGWDGARSYLLVAATHDHSAPDTLGLWGPAPGVSGVDRRYHRRLKETVVRLVKDLAGRLEEAELAAASRSIDPAGLCADSRDPVVIDTELNAFQLRSRRDPRRVLGTVVRWSCHAEALGPDNLLVTADFPGALCARVEERTGGACLYLNGVIGGLLTPDIDPSPARGFAEAGRVGTRIADLALAALSGGADRSASGRVDFSTRTVRVQVENSRYLLFLPILTFGHRLLDARGRPLPRWKAWWLPLRHLLRFPLPEPLRPWVETEIARVRLGPVDLLAIPGELFPELALGGYDGGRRHGHPLVRPTNPDPPDLSRAPEGPYLRARLGSRHGLLVGPANDELGYFLPGYDFKVRGTRSMTPRLPGHHYEETNSIGPGATDVLLRAYDELLRETR